MGLGGYAGSLCNVLQTRFAHADRNVRLAAVCEPDQTTHAARIDQLSQSGVRIFSDYQHLLADDVDGVCLPLPIDLHRPFTERACEAGKAVLCEKPAAGTVDDLDAMIAARDRAGVSVAIGFQHIYDDATLQRKGQLLARPRATRRPCLPAGRAIRLTIPVTPGQGSFAAITPGCSTVRRTTRWRTTSDLALFLLGPDERSSAHAVSLDAELYRVNPIENYDTSASRIRTDTHAELLVLLTHACRETLDPQISFQRDGRPLPAEQRGDGATLDKLDLRVAMFAKFANWRGAEMKSSRHWNIPGRTWWL